MYLESTIYYSLTQKEKRQMSMQHPWQFPRHERTQFALFGLSFFLLFRKQIYGEAEALKIFNGGWHWSNLWFRRHCLLMFAKSESEGKSDKNRIFFSLRRGHLDLRGNKSRFVCNLEEGKSWSTIVNRGILNVCVSCQERGRLRGGFGTRMCPLCILEMTVWHGSSFLRVFSGPIGTLAWIKV